MNSGTLTLTDSTLSGNHAVGGIGGYGAYADGSATGGGLYNYGSATLTNTTVSGNSTQWWGGGLYNAPGGTLTVANSTVSGNYAGQSTAGIGNYSLQYPNRNAQHYQQHHQRKFYRARPVALGF